MDQRVQEICKEEIRAAVRRMESLRLLVQMAYMWRDGDVQESAENLLTVVLNKRVYWYWFLRRGLDQLVVIWSFANYKYYRFNFGFKSAYSSSSRKV